MVQLQTRQSVRELMICVNRIDGIWYHLARKSGMKVNTLSLLFALDDGRARTQRQICQEWIIPKTTINTVVKECIHAGYVQSSAGPDGREKLLSLTEAGRKYADAALQDFYRVENAAMERTLQVCGPQFILAMQCYTDFLKAEADHLAK